MVDDVGVGVTDGDVDGDKDVVVVAEVEDVGDPLSLKLVDLDFVTD